MSQSVAQSSPSSDNNFAWLTQLVQQQANHPGALLPILHQIQHHLGFIPGNAIGIIADGLNISAAEVHGVISFYHDFKTAPGAKHQVQICRAEACQARGSRQLEQHAKQSLHSDYGQATDDNCVQLEPVYCLGNCSAGPSVRIGRRVFGQVDNNKFDSLIEGLRTQVVEVQNAK